MGREAGALSRVSVHFLPLLGHLCPCSARRAFLLDPSRRHPSLGRAFPAVHGPSMILNVDVIRQKVLLPVQSLRDGSSGTSLPLLLHRESVVFSSTLCP